MRCSRYPLLVLLIAVLAGISIWYYREGRNVLLRSLSPRPDLQAYVHTKPSVPIVFTSRSDASAFQAAGPESEGFSYPGTVPWAARAGRLRLLDTTGLVYELTWGRTLPNGGTIIDVLGPSISLDGTAVLFAGRLAPPDAGHWRIYELELKTGTIKQRTGGPEDRGCVQVPPLRYASDGTLLTDRERCRIDYDDLDPSDLGDNHLAFASSRIPDLGRDHTVRATQIWLWQAGMASPQPLTANRNNDRWPVLTSGHLITFSSWSRNREAVTADRTEVQPIVRGQSYATSPTDNWLASQLTPSGTHLGYAIKSQEPVWRPRPLFNGRIVFMTSVPSDPGRYRLAQADWGYLRVAPSSLAPGLNIPNVEEGAQLFRDPQMDPENRILSSGCPSPYPGNRILFASKRAIPPTGTYGLYSIADDWSRENVNPELLFDDPEFEDAEPVAVYRRDIKLAPHELEAPEASTKKPPAIRLVDGQEYTGPAGLLEDLSIRQPNRNPIPWADNSTPGKMQDPRLNVVPPPPNVTSVVIYAAYRDRFDSPLKERIPGEWKKLLVTETGGRDGSLFAWVPSDPAMTIVLAGLDDQGKIAQWSSQAKISAGRNFLAYAGDHYSLVRANGYHHCVGCHSGHSFTASDIRERVK